MWGCDPEKKPQLEMWCHRAEVVTEAREGDVGGELEEGQSSGAPLFRWKVLGSGAGP